MTLSGASAATNPYTGETGHDAARAAACRRLAQLVPLVADQRWNLVAGSVATMVASSVSLLTPLVIGRAVDRAIRDGDFQRVIVWSGVLLCAHLAGFVAMYVQIRRLGHVGRSIL